MFVIGGSGPEAPQREASLFRILGLGGRWVSPEGCMWVALCFRGGSWPTWEARREKVGGPSLGRDRSRGQGQRPLQSRLPGGWSTCLCLCPTPSPESPHLPLLNHQPASWWSRGDKAGTQFPLGAEEEEPPLRFCTKTQGRHLLSTHTTDCTILKSHGNQQGRLPGALGEPVPKMCSIRKKIRIRMFM